MSYIQCRATNYFSFESINQQSFGNLSTLHSITQSNAAMCDMERVITVADTQDEVFQRAVD